MTSAIVPNVREAGQGCPVLLLGGTASPSATRELLPRLAQALPGASLELLPALGHMAPVTHPEIVNPRIVAFLRAMA